MVTLLLRSSYDSKLDTMLEVENQVDEAADTVDYQPENHCRRLHSAVARRIQLRQSSEAVPLAREVSLLQHRELHFLVQKCA